MQIQEFERLTISMNDDFIVLILDECHGELARYGIAGDCLNHNPCIDESDLQQLGDFVEANVTTLAKGATLFFPMRVVSMGEEP